MKRKELMTVINTLAEKVLVMEIAHQRNKELVEQLVLERDELLDALSEARNELDSNAAM